MASFHVCTQPPTRTTGCALVTVWCGVVQVGTGTGVGFTVNLPWPCGGMGDAEYMAAFDDLLMPVARQFNPDLVLISAGFDAAAGDPLGGCSLTPAGTCVSARDGERES